jgi:hypothetical protein
MNMNKHTIIPGWMVTLLAMIILLAASANVEAIDKVEKKEYLNSLEAQGSFNYARREVFRELYGNGLTLALRYERFKSDKIGLGIRLSRVQLCDAGEYATTKLKYRDLSLAPMITYSMVRTDGFRIFGGAGPGLSFRKVTVEGARTDETGVPIGSLDANQTEVSLYSLMMLGADLNLSRSVFLSARVTYDRHWFGDVTTGDFGDTGGFNFGGSFGLRF